MRGEGGNALRAIHYGAVPAEVTGITGTRPRVVERNEGFEDDYGLRWGWGWVGQGLAGYPSNPHEAADMNTEIGYRAEVISDGLQGRDGDIDGGGTVALVPSTHAPENQRSRPHPWSCRSGCR
jgi:hypothetical protein